MDRMMTTVACKWNELGWEAAGDTLVGGYASGIAGMRKVLKTPSGNLVGGSGEAGFLAKFLAWAQDDFRNGWVIGNETETTVDHAFVTYTVEGKPYVRIFEGKEVFDLATPFYALGSGRPLAVGAMVAGASVEDAVRIACQHDPNSGGEVIVVKHLGRISLPDKLRSHTPIVPL